MKNILESLVVAFSMYSSIPMPRVDWNEKNTKHTLCFFPLIGAVIGAVLLLWSTVAQHFHLNTTLFSAVAVLVPIAITGGIHMDGFCDTVDALSSHQTTERKLQILKDPNAGAFAVMGCVLYFLMQFALWSQVTLKWELVGIVAIGFVLSRALSATAIVSFRCAKNSGLASMFANAAARSQVKFVMVIISALCLMGMIWLDLIAGLACAGAVVLVFLYYHHMSYKQFGGITGDLAGWFVQVSEFALLAVLLVLQLCRCC